MTFVYNLCYIYNELLLVTCLEDDHDLELYLLLVVHKAITLLQVEMILLLEELFVILSLL